MGALTESTVEEAALSWSRELGYAVGPRRDWMKRRICMCASMATTFAPGRNIPSSKWAGPCTWRRTRRPTIGCQRTARRVRRRETGFKGINPHRQPPDLGGAGHQRLVAPERSTDTHRARSRSTDPFRRSGPGAYPQNRKRLQCQAHWLCLRFKALAARERMNHLPQSRPFTSSSDASPAGVINRSSMLVMRLFRQGLHHD